jgi:DNA-binding transcriptional regulator YiaG
MEYDISLNLRHLQTVSSAIDRFDASYIPEPISGCWLWIGAEQGSYGYGRLKVNGKAMQAHKYSYERFVGEVPEKMLVCHHCDNPACVNPYHLFVGTNQDNTNDKVRKNRQAKGKSLSNAQSKNKARGELNGNSKLTKDQIHKIRSLDVSQRKIAKMFGVSQALISKIQRKEMWNV